MRYTVATAPDYEHLTLEECLLHCRAVEQVEDSLFTVLIAVARERIEAETHRLLRTTTVDVWFNDFPRCDTITLPFPASAVAGVWYRPEGLAEREFPNTRYNIDTVSTLARVVLKDSQTWPSDTLETVNAVRVRLTTGWAAGQLPAQLRQAMLVMIAHLYEHREAVVIGNSAAIDSKPVAMAYAHLVNPFRLPSGWAI